MQCRGNGNDGFVSFDKFRLFIECKLNVHKRCTRNVANDCGLDKKKLAAVLADLNINTEPQKMVKLNLYFIENLLLFIFRRTYLVN